MRAFVTGGTGFVGSHLVEALLASSTYKEVRCLVRKNEKWLSGKTYTRINGNLFDLKTIADALENVDVIFHVAGLVRAQSSKEFKKANVEATEHLIRMAQKKNITNIIVLSSLAAVGPSDETPLTENDLCKPISRYGKSKMEMENSIKRIVKENDSIKIIRPPAVYGPRETDIFTMFKTMKMGIFPMVGNGNHPKISMVYVLDLVEGILKSAFETNPGIHTFFMGGNSDRYSWNEIRIVSNSAFKKNTIPIKLKPIWVKKIATLVEGIASLFGKYPVLNKEKANEMSHEWVCSSVKAKEILHYSPSTSLEKGITETIEWYKNHNWL